MRLQRFGITALISLVLIVLSGCGSDSHHEAAEMPQPLEVKLTVNPSSAKMNEKVSFEAKVTQNGSNVDNAQEVTFEIWKDGSENHSKVTVPSAGDGKYVMLKSFTEAGKYHVISHVTADSQHSMPSAEFVVK
ncbi:FixH family protein [Paenibacillus sp. YPG26]|uniref:FixH family protein n=1 Tax=Paenibacillus sp. YPG26 TaxID=2878915 RepID=UPI00203B76F1|nr:FixH family protein [Paenibacillus sp. YPG26]USB34896.1 FixH family protein [Paenibacillus sp. YPG26]